MVRWKTWQLGEIVESRSEQVLSMHVYSRSRTQDEICVPSLFDLLVLKHVEVD